MKNFFETATKMAKKLRKIVVLNLQFCREIYSKEGYTLDLRLESSIKKDHKQAYFLLNKTNLAVDI